MAEACRFSAEPAQAAATMGVDYALTDAAVELLNQFVALSRISW